GRRSIDSRRARRPRTPNGCALSTKPSWKPLIWLQADGAVSAPSRLVCRPQTGPAADAQDRSVADLPSAEDQRAASPAPHLSLPAAASGDLAAGPGLVR